MTESETRELLEKRYRGFTGYCGIRIDEAADGVCRAHLELREHHLNPRGTAHGGLLSTLMDVTAGTAAIVAFDPPRWAVTQSAEAHYLRPARGARLNAEARTVKAGRSVAFVQVEVRDETGSLVTAGSFEMFYVDGGPDRT